MILRAHGGNRTADQIRPHIINKHCRKNRGYNKSDYYFNEGKTFFIGKAYFHYHGTNPVLAVTVILPAEVPIEISAAPGEPNRSKVTLCVEDIVR